MSIPHKLIYRFNIILRKIPERIFVNIDKLIIKFIWKGKGHRITKAIFKKKNKIRNCCIRC